MFEFVYLITFHEYFQFVRNDDILEVDVLRSCQVLLCHCAL